MREHQAHIHSRHEQPDPGIDVRRYLGILRKRLLFFVIPFALISSAGFAITMLLPAVYVAEGKLLVESQQIPTELVRPTITASAKERIQVIEQRIMTRENLLSIADKYQMFPGRRQSMSATEVLDLMRQRTRMVPFELDQARRRSDTVLIALGLDYESESTEGAMRVADALLRLGP